MLRPSAPDVGYYVALVERCYSLHVAQVEKQLSEAGTEAGKPVSSGEGGRGDGGGGTGNVQSGLESV